MNRGGAETFIMNVYRKLDRSRLQFDFIVASHARGAFEDEIEALGGRVFRVPVPRPTGLPGYIRHLQAVMRDNGPYLSVHSHTQFFTALVMCAARYQGIRQRIAHSHSTGDGRPQTLSRRMYRATMRRLILQNATNLIGCSHNAAAYLFGRSSFPDGRLSIVRNGIEVHQHIVDGDRNKLRHELGLTAATRVFGHIGRFEKPKNHAFLIRVFAEMVKSDPAAHMVLAGEGSLRKTIEADICELGLSKHVHLLGMRQDIQRLLPALDVVLFPSLYEGAPLAILEAQAAGIPCLISDGVSSEIDVGIRLTRFLSLSDSLSTWAATALSLVDTPRVQGSARAAALHQHGYDASAAAHALTNIYAGGSPPETSSSSRLLPHIYPHT
jgi:glycosyltransferase EpsF